MKEETDPVKVPAFTPEKPAPAKSLPPSVPPPEPGSRRSDEHEYTPRYVALPKHWQRGHGKRNLIGGVILLCFTTLLLGWALYLAGPSALLTVAACLATATLLYVMARSRLFRQRNGGFVAWAGVALLGVVLVILHHGWLFLAAPSPAATRPGAAVAVAQPSAPPRTTGVETALLRTAFPEKGDANGPAVRIARDIEVEVAGRPYLAKAGDLYPLLDVGIGELRFTAGGHEISIPSAAGEVAAGSADAPVPEEKLATAAPTAPSAKAQSVDFVPPRDLTLKEQVDASQREAIRRYPALKKDGSPENQLFVSAVKEQRFSGATEFFANPNWPLELAKILAEREGWRRADVIEEAPRPSGQGLPVR